MWSIFSNVYLPPVYFLWWCACWRSWPIFYFSYCSALSVFCIFWIIVFYQMCLLQIVSPGLWLILSFYSIFCRAEVFNFNEFQLLNNLLPALCLSYCIYMFLSRIFDVLFHKVFTEPLVYHTVRSRNPIHWIILGNS